MKLKELLSYYQPLAFIDLKDENGEIIDTGRNGNLVKTLWGDRKVVKFFATDKYNITIILKNKENI